ncbi:hypothetical protein [Candidatus Vampirococcus lugosii]|uniref:Peptidoglycan binding-like domain-containing protein n=1 Tax=Candidatus Vampirococcus lugosii TaxID=2789015 RepID=A0ABS5QL67_9BACT|nr:hypothetical protein [Candidatus Vampirococcus lugosii]MBS8121844.1 hypothetical protein [Candidatus Vampirococcus lugosii]
MSIENIGGNKKIESNLLYNNMYVGMLRNLLEEIFENNKINKNEGIKDFQQKLNNKLSLKGYKNISVDGKFGGQSLEAVRIYHNKYMGGEKLIDERQVSISIIRQVFYDLINISNDDEEITEISSKKLNKKIETNLGYNSETVRINRDRIESYIDKYIPNKGIKEGVKYFQSKMNEYLGQMGYIKILEDGKFGGQSLEAMKIYYNKYIGENDISIKNINNNTFYRVFESLEDSLVLERQRIKEKQELVIKTKEKKTGNLGRDVGDDFISSRDN